MSGQTRPSLAVLKLSAILLKYATFDGVLNMFSWAKHDKYKISVSAHYRVETKNLNKISKIKAKFWLF